MKVIVRALVVAVLAFLVGWVTNLLSDDGTANIGAGLFALLTVLVVAFVWALRDARRDALARVLVRWAVVGVLVGLGFAVLPQVGSDEFFSLDTYLSDVPGSAPVGLALTLGAAAVGGLVGALLGRRSTPADERQRATEAAAADG